MNENTQTTENRSCYVSYLLRLWRDDAGDDGTCQRPGLWRGSLENPHTGQRLGFPSLDALCEHLRVEIAGDSAPPDRGRSDEGSQRSRVWIVALGVLVVSLALTGCMSVAADSGIAGAVPSVSNPPNPGQAVGVQVTLSAAHTTKSWDDRDPARVKFDLPLLYLHHDGAATPPSERTLNLSIAGLPVGSAVHVEVVSLHKNPNTGNPHTASKRFTLPDRPCTIEAPCTLEWALEPATMLSDLYYVYVKDDSGGILWSNPSPNRPDVAALDLWDIAIDAYTMRLVYATLFPFRRDPDQPEGQLSPAAVPDFIARQFLPMIEATWRTQLEEWGFGQPMHPQWDADGVVEIIITDPPFALFDGTGTYTVFTDATGQPVPDRRIWWLSTHPVFARYDSWENAHRTILAHEFFHMAQWNVLLNTGSPANHWLNTVIEAQAEFAVSVQYPELELSKHHVLAGRSAYANSANGFLVNRPNDSYRLLEAEATSRYDLALYWRFLYERYDDMGVIRAALEEMALHYQPDIVTSMRRAMDAALARFDGPFHTHEDSLIAFSRANYALRLENGRCTAEEFLSCAGLYYDPEGVYVNPPLAFQLDYYGEPLAYRDAVPSSFGMDFVEIGLNPMLRGQPLTIRFQGKADAARFNLQVWRLKWRDEGLRAVTPQPDVVGRGPDGAYAYHIPAVDTTAYDRLALIITRIDADEIADPIGAYLITLGGVD